MRKASLACLTGMVQLWLPRQVENANAPLIGSLQGDGFPIWAQGDFLLIPGRGLANDLAHANINARQGSPGRIPTKTDAILLTLLGTSDQSSKTLPIDD